MSDIRRAGTTARYSDFCIHDGVVHCVEVPPAPGDVTAQTAAMLASLERLLVEAGSGKDRLLMATLYLIDMDDYAAVNAIWDAWIPPGTAPCRACVQVARLADPTWRVEVAVQAALRR